MTHENRTFPDIRLDDVFRIPLLGEVQVTRITNSRTKSEHILMATLARGLSWQMEESEARDDVAEIEIQTERETSQHPETVTIYLLVLGERIKVNVFWVSDYFYGDGFGVWMVQDTHQRHPKE